MKIYAWLAGLVGFFLVAAPTLAQDAVIQVGSGTAPPGEGVEIVIELVSSPAPVTDIQGVLAFNPSVMHIDPDSVEGLNGFDANLFYNVNNSTGQLIFASFIINDGITSGGVLKFTAVAVGTIGESTTLDLTMQVLRDENGADIPHQARDGTFMVGPTNLPEVDFTWEPESPLVGEEVFFYDQTTFPQGTAPPGTLYEWDFGDGSAPVNIQNPTHVYTRGGTYTVTLTVIVEGFRVWNTHPITVQGPRADFTYTPLYPTTQDVVQFQDRSESPLGDIVEWQWDFGDGKGSTDRNPTHQYASRGTYTVTLTITDETGTTASVAKQITVGNVPPVADFDFNPQSPEIGELITFSSAGSHDPDGQIVLFEWDFNGDGITDATGSTAKYAFASGGVKNVTLTVTDDLGATDSITRGVPVGFQAPRAEFTFSPDQPVVGETVHFSAEDSSDPDGQIVLYEWDFDDDGLTDATGPNAYWAFQTPGSKPVTLIVTDDDGAWDVVTHTVPVQAADVPPGDNQPPSAEFTFDPESPKIGEAVIFSAAGSSDPDGEIVAYEWDFNNDGIYEKMGATVTHVFYTGGSKVVKLRVTDDGGAADVASKAVPVEFIPPVPDFTYTPARPTVGELVSFDASGSEDPDGEVVFYEWDFDGDGETDATGQFATHVFDQGGTRPVTLTVTDNEGNTASITRSVYVEIYTNQPPIAQFSYTPEQPTTVDTIQFTDKSTDPDGQIVAWLWEFGDGTTSEEQHPTHRYPEPGTYTVTLTVTDDEGAQAQTQQEIMVQEGTFPPPTITSLLADPTAPEVGQPVTFTATASAPEDDPVSGWEWDFGDGTTSTDPPPVTHTYAESRVYTVRVRAKNETGGWGPWYSIKLYVRTKGGPAIGTELAQNPVATQAVIYFFLPEGATEPVLYVFDLLGRPVYQSDAPSDSEFRWNLQNDAGRDVPNGLYFYLILATHEGRTIRSQIGRILVLR